MVTVGAVKENVFFLIIGADTCCTSNCEGQGHSVFMPLNEAAVSFQSMPHQFRLNIDGYLFLIVFCSLPGRSYERPRPVKTVPSVRYS